MRCVSDSFHDSRGVVIAASETRKGVMSTLNKFTLSRSTGQKGALTRRFARREANAAEEATRPSTDRSKPLKREMKYLQEEMKELWIAFEGECTFSFLHDKVVVAHMKNVSDTLEGIKKTLDDFKTDADP
ncbi:hypothetical protein CJ030_MR8G004399 [Morella rubra]|uniref:Uncharacterized protein n=1 Tax=Morella rubra TaxID=262757 RepID=A0A6A1UQG7_9ROSI|nr:hypothetical protein CJ030_MR8G004399 [Morella rubra]